MISPEVAVALLVIGIAIGIHIGRWLANRDKTKAVTLISLQAQLLNDELRQANRLLDRYASDRHWSG